MIGVVLDYPSDLMDSNSWSDLHTIDAYIFWKPGFTMA